MDFIFISRVKTRKSKESEHRVILNWLKIILKNWKNIFRGVICICVEIT